MGTHSKVVNFLGGVILLSLLCLLLAPGQGQAATFTVNSTADVANLQANCTSGTGQCTLRSAIQAANASAAADTIVLPAGTYTLTIAGRNENAAATGDLDIVVAGGPLNITGAGAATTIIDAGGLDRVFDVSAQSPVTISDVTIRDGNSGGAIGGGILTGGAGISLTLNNVIITGNQTGVANIEGDAIDIGGGGAVVTMNNVAITNNISLGGGNIVSVGGAGTSLTINGGTISGNNDSAIGNGGTVSLTNVTISGNTAVNGTGIDNKAGATVTLVNVTITDNVATPPANFGGVRNLGAMTAKNTIIANNTPINCNLPLTSQGNNLSNAAGCFAGVGDIVAAAPLLGALANNGGPLQTVALLLGSPAIDAGTNVGCPATDERGAIRPRPIDGNIPLDGIATCDIGAFEFKPQTITVTLAPPFDFGTVTSATTADHVITISNAGDGPLIIGTIAGADPLAAPFSIAVDSCSGLTLPFAASCAITTRFTPTAALASSDTFNIPSNDPATPAVIFALTGTGTAQLVPLITVTDSIAPANDLKVPFGGVAVGNSADATVTITNTGTSNLILGTIASADPLAAPFSITGNTCTGATIAPSAACTFSLHFAPTADGPANDTFDIPTNVAGAVTMTVSGTGGVATAGTGGNNPPTNPVLVSPENGQTGVATTFTFVWNKSSDPDGDAITYHFQNCTDENFTTGCTNSDVQAAAPSRLLYAGLGSFGAGIVLIGFVAGSGLRRSKKTMLVITLLLLAGGLFMSCTRTKTETVQVPAPGTTAGQISNIVRDLAPNTTYHWKVVADDGKGGTASSPVSTYTTGQ